MGKLGEWSKRLVDLSTTSPELRHYLADRANGVPQIVSARSLLLHMRVAQDQAIRYSHQRFTTYVIFGDHNRDDPVGGLCFEDRRSFFLAYMEADPRVCEARQRLQLAGISTFWSEGGEYTTKTLELLLPVNDDTIDAVCKIAKRDAGIFTMAQSMAYDRQFELFFRQNFDSEREYWRNQGSIVEQP